MKVVGIGKVYENQEKGTRRVTVYLENERTPVMEGAAYEQLVVFASASQHAVFDTALNLHVGDQVLPLRNQSGYLEDIVYLGGAK